jgi:hypothetical protein
MKPDHVLGLTACACCLIIVATFWVSISLAMGFIREYSPRAVIAGAAESQEIVAPERP